MCVCFGIEERVGNGVCQLSIEWRLYAPVSSPVTYPLIW